ncbi:MAG TPA: HlyD family secretion protein [Planctomycetaceae bacterium]|nr:HlyD family secretion protein [Planctomycetaceae bacterium]
MPLLFCWNALLFCGNRVRALARRVRRLLLSARAWILFIVLVIALLVAYYILETRHTPFTSDAYAQAYVVQVAPRFQGLNNLQGVQVVQLNVRESQAVKKGELLFAIDDRPFLQRVALLDSKRVQTISQVAQMESDLAAAKAEEARLTAEEAYAKVVFDQESMIFKGDATTERGYKDAVQKHKAAQAARQRAQAQVRKAEQWLAARIGEKHALIAEAEAELELARLNLEWTRVYAPANGYVTNFQLREGSYVHSGTPVLTLIDDDQWWVVANFRENALENIRPGQRVGIAFNTYPGRIFPGTVRIVGWGVNQGQGAPTGTLPNIDEPRNWIRLAQRFQVWITPELSEECPLRVGATASVVVYTQDKYWLNQVTEVWQQIVSHWNYLY